MYSSELGSRLAGSKGCIQSTVPTNLSKATYVSQRISSSSTLGCHTGSEHQPPCQHSSKDRITYRASLGRLLCRPLPRLVDDALEAAPVPVPAGILELDAGTSAEADGIAEASEDGALATSVASPELAVDAGVEAGSEPPTEEATGALLEAAGALLEAAGALLEAAGAAAPPFEKSTTAGPGQVNCFESLSLTL